ncbi:MAG: oxidoreductase [Marmoricola sp.]|nr:oxidoreductase [Marmoricola sp.]
MATRKKPARPDRTSRPEGPDGSAYSDGRTRLLLGGGVLLAVCAVIAGLVIFSSGGEAVVPSPRASVTADATSLVVGRADAPATVVVREDLTSPTSRSFDDASRDFLEIMAAQGRVRVVYQPVHGASAPTGYAATALGAWARVLRSGTPRQALRFQRMLLDAQPVSGASPPGMIDLARRAGVRDTGVLSSLSAPPPDALVRAGARPAGVLLNGRPVAGSSPVAVADSLQRALLRFRG